MKSKNKDLIMQNKVFAWVVAVTGGILCIPLVVMQFTSEVDWDVSDFIVMAVLLFCAGFTFVHVARVVPRKYRTLIGIVFVLGVLYIWAELAVGIFTNLGS